MINGIPIYQQWDETLSMGIIATFDRRTTWSISFGSDAFRSTDLCYFNIEHVSQILLFPDYIVLRLRKLEIVSFCA